MFTLGMATYDDYDGVYFTIQAARLYHPDITEIIILDNNPSSVHGKTVEKLVNWQSEACKVKYIPYTQKQSTSVRNFVFENASNNHVIVSDSHVLFLKNSIEALKDYYLTNHKAYDFIQGPMVYDDCKSYSTHLKPGWNDNFYGVWETSESEESFFEIPSMGLGVFSCKKEEWLGFNSLFRGFGGEEGYIHEKYRQKGGRCICLRDFKWLHRFDRPLGVPYKNILEDRVYNYFIGKFELGLDYSDVVDHFINGSLNKPIVQTIFNDAYNSYYGKENNLKLF
jgi:hypothetical protein